MTLVENLTLLHSPTSADVDDPDLVLKLVTMSWFAWYGKYSLFSIDDLGLIYKLSFRRSQMFQLYPKFGARWKNGNIKVKKVPWRQFSFPRYIFHYLSFSLTKLSVFRDWWNKGHHADSHWRKPTCGTCFLSCIENAGGINYGATHVKYHIVPALDSSSLEVPWSNVAPLLDCVSCTTSTTLRPSSRSRSLFKFQGKISGQISSCSVQP